jgi:flagellar protein FlaG
MASIDSSIPEIPRPAEFTRPDYASPGAQRSAAQPVQTQVPADATASVRKEPDKASQTPDELEKRLQSLVEKLQSTSLRFSIDEDTKRIIVKIVDKETGNVIQEIPQTKFQNLVTQLEEIVGYRLDRTI